MFDVDFEILAWQLLPTRKRGVSILRFLNAALKPLRDLHVEFLEYRSQSKLKASYNSQVLSIQTYLRNLFGTDLITIIDADERTSIYVYNNIEPHDEPYLYQTDERNIDTDALLDDPNNNIIYNSEEDQAGTVDAIVQCPGWMNNAGTEAQLKSAIGQYLFPDKNFKIEYL